MNTNSSFRGLCKFKAWDRKETDLIVSLRMDQDEYFQRAKPHGRMWKDITGNIQRKRCKVTFYQCSNKWKSLKRAYVETVHSDSNSGNIAKTCPYNDDYICFNTYANTNPALAHRTHYILQGRQRLHIWQTHKITLRRDKVPVVLTNQL